MKDLTLFNSTFKVIKLDKPIKDGKKKDNYSYGEANFAEGILKFQSNHWCYDKVFLHEVYHMNLFLTGIEVSNQLEESLCDNFGNLLMELENNGIIKINRKKIKKEKKKNR